MNTLELPQVTKTKCIVSPTEREIWRLIALGYSRKEIANMPGRKKSTKTVDTQRCMLIEKLRNAGIPARGTADLTRSALRYGVIELESVS